MPLRKRILLFDPTAGRSTWFYLVDLRGEKAVYESELTGWQVLIPLDDPLISE